MKVLRAGGMIVDEKGHLIGKARHDIQLEQPVFASDLELAETKGKKKSEAELNRAIAKAVRAML